jgi:hypothetical protein
VIREAHPIQWGHFLLTPINTNVATTAYTTAQAAMRFTAVDVTRSGAKDVFIVAPILATPTILMPLVIRAVVPVSIALLKLQALPARDNITH